MRQLSGDSWLLRLKFGGGILILLGLFTRPASAFMAFTMHTSKLDPWSKAIYPMKMFAVFMDLLFIGAGKYSIDALIIKKIMFFHNSPF